VALLILFYPHFCVIIRWAVVSLEGLAVHVLRVSGCVVLSSHELFVYFFLFCFIVSFRFVIRLLLIASFFFSSINIIVLFRVVEILFHRPVNTGLLGSFLHVLRDLVFSFII
jgi:hypothetical protein